MDSQWKAHCSHLHLYSYQADVLCTNSIEELPFQLQHVDPLATHLLILISLFSFSHHHRHLLLILHFHQLMIYHHPRHLCYLRFLFNLIIHHHYHYYFDLVHSLIQAQKMKMDQRNFLQENPHLATLVYP